MAENKQSERSLSLKDLGNTYVQMLTKMVRTTHQIPNSITDKQIAGIVLLATETARTNKSTQTQNSNMNHAIAGISASLTVLENEGTRDAHELQSGYQQKFSHYRGTASDLITRREELIKLMSVFIGHLDQKIKEMVEALLAEKSKANLKKTTGELRAELSNIEKRLENITINETSLTHNLIGLLKECVQTTKALTGRDVLSREQAESLQQKPRA